MKIRIFRAILIHLILLIILGHLQHSAASAGRGYGIVSPALSPDNKKIILVVCKRAPTCDLAIYEIATGKMHRFNPAGKQSNGAPAYSPDGKKITFTSGEDNDSNIFIMNADGSNVRQLTHIYNKNLVRDGNDVVMKINGCPTFSPDGKRIIFDRSGVMRQRSMGGEMLSHFDVYEVDVATKAERKLMDYKFYRISRVYYMPDGKRFIFSGMRSAGYKDYFLKYKDNTIYIMDGRNNELCPAFIYGDWTSDPSVSKDGNILFVARTNHLDGNKGPYTYDLFINKKGSIRRLTKRQFSQIAEPFISFDGSRAVFLANIERGAGPSLWVVNSDGTGLRDINLPSWEQMK